MPRSCDHRLRQLDHRAQTHLSLLAQPFTIPSARIAWDVGDRPAVPGWVGHFRPVCAVHHVPKDSQRRDGGNVAFYRGFACDGLVVGGALTEKYGGGQRERADRLPGFAPPWHGNQQRIDEARRHRGHINAGMHCAVFGPRSVLKRLDVRHYHAGPGYGPQSGLSSWRHC